LLQLLEETAGIEKKASQIIDEVKGYRIRADHVILGPEFHKENYIELFNVLCDDVSYALSYFSMKMEAAIHDKANVSVRS
jgi:hypothetical protein